MKRYIEIGKKLFPIHRSITGKGVIKTLKIFQKEIKDLKIKKIKSGIKVFDWKVPDEWNIKDAFVKDKNGKKIINFKRNNLHIVSYSQPIDQTITKKELVKHLHFLKKQKKAIPYVTSYYKKYWGFCTSYIDYKKIIKKYKTNDKFHVKIDSEFKKNGNMTYGELKIKGKSNKEILISTNICHPSMANNELSGPLVALALAKYFKKFKNLKRSIRFLFLPETIGAIAYLKKNLIRMKKNVIGGYTLTCIGDNKNYSYLYTKYKNCPSDFAALKACRELKIDCKKYNYLYSESDERRYNSPFVELGIGSIMRTKYHSFPEYHTSLDNFNLVTAKGLQGGYNFVKKAIKNLTKIKLSSPNKRSIRKTKLIIGRTICEPNLGKRNLYPLLSRKDNEFKTPHRILDFLQYADGTNDLRAISNYINCPLKKTSTIFSILAKNKLVKYVN